MSMNRNYPGMGMSVADLQKFAKRNLSSFDGFEGSGRLVPYTGKGDPMLDFQGEGKNFATIGQNDMQFIINIKNTGAAKRILLIPGWDYTSLDLKLVLSAGTAIAYPKKGVLADTVTPAIGAYTMTNFADLDGNAFASGDAFYGSPFSLDTLYKWLSENPTALGAIRVQSDNASQVMQQITYKKLSPFKQLETKQINLGINQDENTFRDKLVTVQTPGLILSNQTQLEMVVMAASSMSITFFFAGSLNTSKLMQAKVDQAVNTIAAIGPENAQKLAIDAV